MILPILPPSFQGQIGPNPEQSKPDPAILGGPKAPADAPNILLILVDDAGYADNSVFGGSIPTPNFEALAKAGLRYSQFNVTPMCSSTRAALLTGRNHHSVGMGRITSYGALPYPGYTTFIPKSAAMVSEILRDNGYATAAIGKWHITPNTELGPTGPFDRWPTGEGFDYFWGFMAAEADQFHPQLSDGTRPTDFDIPPGRDGDYDLTEAIADKAVAWIRTAKSVAPDKPFFLYFAPGATHAPLQVPKSWTDRFHGKFDMGWDKYREEALARQKNLGLVPQNTRLSPRPAEIPAWDSLSAADKRLYARQMEVYAGMMAQTDYEIGRVIQTLRDTGQLDNTLIILIGGDNGASMEGGPEGTANTMGQINHVPETAADREASIARLGLSDTTPMYAAGWAMAGNTPYPWGKRIASGLGGTRAPLVISWPKRIKDPGAVRTQYEHVIDIAPTLLDAAKVPQPKSVNGVAQQPFDGQSILPTIDNGATPSARHTQYYEMLGSLAIYQDGWFATRRTNQLPWSYGDAPPLQYLPWELYNLNVDFSQSKNVAAQYPEKLKALEGTFDAEARKYQVYPIDGRMAQFGGPAKPFHATYYGATRMFAWPPIDGRNYAIKAEIEVPKDGGQGVLVSAGAESGGFTLWMNKGVLSYTYNYFQKRITQIADTRRLAPGKATILLKMDLDHPVAGSPANVTLTVDGRPIGSTRLPETAQGKFSFEDTFDVGEDSGSAVGPYSSPNKFNGTIDRVDLDVSPQP